MTVPVTGGCLCGAVRFEARVHKREVRACTCNQCQRQNAGAWYDVPSSSDVVWQGLPRVYRSSDHATRGFCARCGSTVYWQEDGLQPALSHGAMDERDGWRLLERIEHEDTRPDAYRVVPTTAAAR